MTTDPRAAAEKWLKQQFMAQLPGRDVDQITELFARIAADFAERLCKARDEQIDDTQKNGVGIPIIDRHGTSTAPLGRGDAGGQAMTWPSACPKCGMADLTHSATFYIHYCNTIDCRFRPLPKREHLHHRCQRCDYEMITPCKDAGEEPGK